MLARKNSPVDIRSRDVEACVLTPSILAERCVGALMGCRLDMPEISPFVFIAAVIRCIVVLEIRKCLFKRGCFECGGMFRVF